MKKMKTKKTISQGLLKNGVDSFRESDVLERKSFVSNLIDKSNAKTKESMLFSYLTAEKPKAMLGKSFETNLYQIKNILEEMEKARLRNRNNEIALGSVKDEGDCVFFGIVAISRMLNEIKSFTQNHFNKIIERAQDAPEFMSIFHTLDDAKLLTLANTKAVLNTKVDPFDLSIALDILCGARMLTQENFKLVNHSIEDPRKIAKKIRHDTMCYDRARWMFGKSQGVSIKPMSKQAVQTEEGGNTKLGISPGLK